MAGSLLAVTAFVLLLVYLTLFVALHLQRTGYSPIRNAVSEYGVGLAAVVVTMVVPALRRVFGLSERVYLLSTNVWFLIVALCLTVDAW
ncbi:hypothetical protein GCM10009557_02680 [Virgisporangium ochraceum]|uniref:Uncharacterized protein n=1 Tax=Virgisporangium ochraceum TaxID=65505 RepID=A0A8J4EI26_9ACTN|nr:hypothetical protein [Virgisporangium ochraceum]GIJ72807.1 hypothetical protein Voc01_077240 [Virgisporangium ochraceum]